MIRHIVKLAKFRYSQSWTNDVDNYTDSECDINNGINSQKLIKVQNTQELMTLLSEHVDPKALSEIYKMNKGIFEVQHSLLILRIISHFLTSAKQYLHDGSFRQVMNEISLSLNQKLESIPPIELLELLFFKSKYFLRGASTIIEKIDDKKLQRALSNMIKKNQDFSIRHYINIYYDSQVLNMDVPQLRQYIQEKINKEPLSATEIILLLRCELIRSQKKKLLDITIVEFCINHFQTNILYYDFQQVQQFYGMMLKMKYHYFNPQIEVHQVIFDLRNVLIKNLKKIDEHTLISIVGLYENLPKQIQPTLELQIKDFMLKQLNQQPNKISLPLMTHFLQQCHLLCSQIEIDKIIQEIIQRLQSDANLHTAAQANRIGQYVLNLRNIKLSINSRIMLTTFQEYIQQTCKFSFPDLGIMYLRFVCGINVDSLISEEHLQRYPFCCYAVITNEQLKLKLHTTLLIKIRENPIKSVQEICKYNLQENPFEDIIPTVILEVFRKPNQQEKILGMILKLINDQKSANLFKECISTFRQEVYRLACRQQQLTSLQVQSFGQLLIQHIEGFQTHSMLNVIVHSNLVALIGQTNPERLSSIVTMLKQTNGGLCALSFCKYLQDNDVDYTKCLRQSQQNARLDLLYQRYETANIENKLIILYLIFFN